MLTAYLALVTPFRGRRRYRRLRAEIDVEPRARTRWYRRSIVGKWIHVVAIGVIIAISPRAGLRDIGVVWPHSRSGVPWIVSIELIVAIVVSTVLYRITGRRGRRIPGQDSFRALLPRTGSERRWAYGVAFTAGVTEELIFRGLILNAAIWAGMPIVVALTISSLLFGVVHLYQGRWGVIATALVGSLLGWLYLATLSIVLPVVLHVLLDLRGLVWIPASSAPVSMAPEPPAQSVNSERPRIRSSVPIE
jgi:membrane protease YdiL (CAAX protease family)